MSIFDFLNTGGGNFDPFFSLKGQQQRISNVVNEFNIFSTNKNTLNPEVKKNVPAIVSAPLQFIAENPYTTVAIVAAASNPLPIATAAGKAFTSASLLTKTAIVGGTLIAGPAIISHPAETIQLINKYAPTPDKALDLGKNLNQLIEDPNLENAKRLLESNGIFLAESAIIALLALGGLSAIANYIIVHSTNKNTKAVKENTNASLGQSNTPKTTSEEVLKIKEKVSKSIPTPTASPIPTAAPNPVMPEVQTLPKASSGAKKKKKKTPTKKKKKVAPKNKRKSIKRKKSTKKKRKSIKRKKH
jgi:hypothetical protein